MFFDDWISLGRVIIISVCAYAALIVVLRIAGKRSLGKLNAFDLVVTVALGSTLATVLLTTEVALAEGVLAFAMLIALQFVVTRASVQWRWAKRLVRSEPQLVFKDGRYLEDVLHDERVTRAEVDQAIRSAGFGRTSDVAAVVMETNGTLSVIGKDRGPGDLTALPDVPRNAKTSAARTEAASRPKR